MSERTEPPIHNRSPWADCSRPSLAEMWGKDANLASFRSNFFGSGGLGASDQNAPWIRSTLGIVSRRDLTAGSAAAERFDRIYGVFATWVFATWRRGVNRFSTPTQYHELLAMQGCAICRRPAAIHSLTGAGSGKEQDWWDGLPLCAFHHSGAEGIHEIGVAKWEVKHGRQHDLIIEAIRRL